MKLRQVLLASLVALSLSFTACGSEKLEEPLSQNRETYIGEFKSLGSISVNKTITHLFETEDGEILYAYSDRYDLDSSAYLDVEVEAYGLVLEYESLDKLAFEVQRITDAPEEDDEEEEVEMLDYKDTDLGFLLSYPSNWAFSALRDSVRLVAPENEVGEDEAGGRAEPLDPDYVIVAQTGITLSTNSDNSSDERAEEIRAAVQGQYSDLLGSAGLVSSIGVDAQFAVLYKTESGNVHYFAPRSDQLYEISFYHPSPEEGDRVKNTNLFSQIVASFRFLPMDGSELEEVEEEETEEEEVVEEVEKETSEEPETLGEQVSFSKYRELESAPYGFAMSYPGNWYYQGGLGYYAFAEESFEDDSVEAVIRLNINSDESLGKANYGDDVHVTVEVDGVRYTLVGPSAYAEVMVLMSESIVSTEE